jgi:hypothetical protein
MDITGFQPSPILHLSWEIVEKALFNYSVVDQILIFSIPAFLRQGVYIITRLLFLLSMSHILSY